MQPASRASLATARERLDARLDGAQDLERVGTDLGGVVAVLAAEPVLRRNLGDASAPEQARRSLADSLFGGQLGAAAAETVGDVVTSRWSRPRDLTEALDLLGSQALFTASERAGNLDEVEDELFRFGRVLDEQPKLVALLSDRGTPLDGRLRLLGNVLHDRVQPITGTLLEQAVRAPRGRRLNVVVEDLVERAADRRERSVAHVTVAAPLTGQQEQRLVDTLGRIYRRSISLKFDLDPELLGGIVVRVGDEVIDGSVASRLAKARQWLPH